MPAAEGLPLIAAVSQFDGSKYASANCAAASGARLRWYLTHVRTSGAMVRNAQYDYDGGISIPDVGRALANLIPTVHPAWAAPNDGLPIPSNRTGSYISEGRLINLLEQGYMVIVQGDYGNLPAAYREQVSFTDDHAFTVDSTTVSHDRLAYVVDTIPKYGTGYDGRWIPWSALMSYAFGLAGKGRIYAMWGRRTVAPTGYRASIQPDPPKKYRAFLTYEVVNPNQRPLLINAHSAPKRTKGFSAVCSAPINTKAAPGFHGELPDLVLLLDGSRKGQYIDAQYASRT